MGRTTTLTNGLLTTDDGDDGCGDVRPKAMELNMTQLWDLDPMLDDIRLLVRCISIWKSRPIGKPNEVWSLDCVLQDQQGNWVQATTKNQRIKD
ncbi:hypothetical protein Tco_0648863 [Tanacetum coccineum]